MRLLLDQGLAVRAAAILRAEQFDAVHTEEVGLARAEDMEILEYSRRENRICVTLDHDFHAHLARVRADGPSVIFVRVQALDANAQARLVRTVCEHCREALDEGVAVSVDSSSIRIRRLPL